MKRIFHLLFISIVLTNFANATEITSWKDNYPTGNATWIEVKDKPNNHEDWIGIYPSNSNNSWSNVIAWRWARDTSPTTVDPGDWYEFQLNDGAYEARFFLNNTYVVEDSVAFNVGETNEPMISIDNDAVGLNKSIQVSLSNLSGNQDWVGIYRKGDSNSWSNVVTWEWADNPNITLAGVSAGEYEARLFFNNSFQTEASVSFSVDDGNTEFWQKGAYEIAPIIEVGNDGLAYYPKNLQGKNAPVVFLVKNHSSPREKLRTLINFIASHGYYVIAIDSSVAGSNNFTQPRTKIAPRYIEIVNYLKEKGYKVDTSKIGVVGSSASGGNTFGVLQRLKKEGYGSNASFILAIESWFAFEMKKDEMRALVTDNTYVSILEYGVKGNLKKQVNPFTGRDYTTDALFPLVNFLHIKANGNYLDNINYQVFEPVGDRGHLYHQDSSVTNGTPGENYAKMKGVLNPLGGLMEFVFEDNNLARPTALEQGTDSPIRNNQVKIKEYGAYNYKCNASSSAPISYCDERAADKNGNRDYINSIDDLNF